MIINQFKQFIKRLLNKYRFKLIYIQNCDIIYMQQQSNKSKVDKYGYQYSQKKLIARGSYGSVYLCQRVGEISPNPFNNFFYENQSHESKYCAIKIYNQRLNLEQGVQFSTLRELNMMLIGNHPNILSAHQAFFNRQKIQLVMDFHLDLPDIIHEQNIIKNQNNKKLICYQITKGLVYLHQNYIMHRDLKPSNIFISKQGITKIGDFGMCKYYGTPKQKFTPYVCTRQYRAPELFLYTNYYTQKADIWSLGCIYYYIFTGQHLFSSDNKSSQLAIITKIFSIVGTPTEQNWPGFKKMPKVFEFLPYPKKDLAKEKGLDEQLSRLIQFCINLDPKKRPEAHQLLNHQYFKEFSLGKRQFDYLPATELYESKINNILNRVEQELS